MGKLSSKQLNINMTVICLEWNFIADQDGDLWVNKKMPC